MGIEKIVEEIDRIVEILTMDTEEYVKHYAEEVGGEADADKFEYPLKAGEAEAKLITLSIRIKNHYNLRKEVEG